jgi:thiol-disulfide isomerase/thioredoxin
MRRTLTLVTDVALLCAALVVVADLAWRYHAPFLALFGVPAAAAQGAAGRDSAASTARRDCSVPTAGPLKSPGAAASAPRNVPPAKITWLPRAGYEQADRTVALVLAQGCGYCQASMPFYRRLNEAQKGGRFRMVVITPDPADAFRRFLGQQSVSADAVISVSAADLSVRGTPTLVVLDRTGSVREFRTGRLSQEEETRLLAVLAGGA